MTLERKVKQVVNAKRHIVENIISNLIQRLGDANGITYDNINWNGEKREMLAQWKHYTLFFKISAANSMKNYLAGIDYLKEAKKKYKGRVFTFYVNPNRMVWIK